MYEILTRPGVICAFGWIFGAVGGYALADYIITRKYLSGGIFHVLRMFATPPQKNERARVLLATPVVKNRYSLYLCVIKNDQDFTTLGIDIKDRIEEMEAQAQKDAQ